MRTSEDGLGLDGLGFPEALRWRDGELWFSDMFRGRVVRWRPGAAPLTVLDRSTGSPPMPGGLGWTPDGDLLVVDCLGRRVLRAPVGRPPAVHADLSDLLAHPANDMHVDPDGTAVIGGYGFDPGAEDPRPTRLITVTPGGAAHPWGDPVVFPNGCERTPDGRLVVAETFADRVSLLTSGGERSTLAELEPGAGPDGLSVSDDDVLVALAFAGRVVRLALAPGGAAEVVHRSAPVVGGPGSGPTGCYDVAVRPGGTVAAVASASLDESLAERVDTGTIRLVQVSAGGSRPATPG